MTNTLRRPDLIALLDELYADAVITDAPLRAQLRALSPEERAALWHDYKHVFGLARHAYLPVDRDAGELLYLLARARGARRIVEFGTSFGLSTIYLASALRDGGGGSLLTTELEPEKAARARANLERAGLADLVEIRVGDALETLADVPGPIDFVYLDGAKTLYRPELDLLEPHLAPSALITADNMRMSDLLGSFTSYVRDPAGRYLSHTLPVGDGLELSLRA